MFGVLFRTTLRDTEEYVYQNLNFRLEDSSIMIQRNS